MNRKKIVTGLLCMAGLLPVCAQQRVLSVDEMFRLADTNSRSIRSYRLAVDETKQGTKTAKSDKLPSIEANLSFSYIGNGWMTDRDFSDGQKASMPHYGNNFAIKATQVVYAGGAINRSIQLSELQQQVAELELQDNRQEVRFLLVGYYLELYQLYNQQEVYEKNIEQTRLLVKEIQAAFQQGTALKSDITRYELQLQNLELGLTSTRNRIKILNRQSTTTIGLAPETVILPDTTVLARNIGRRDELSWQGMKNESPRLKLADLGVEMSKKQQDLVRAGRRPNIGLVAANNFDGPILIEVPPIDKNFNYWYVGIGISYKFDALFKNNKKLKQARIATRKAEEDRLLADEQVSNGIHSAWIELDEAYSRLRTREKSVQLAHENYDVVHYRYLNGLSLVTDMLDASNIQLSSELELTNARIGILYQYYLLKRTIGSL